MLTYLNPRSYLVDKSTKQYSIEDLFGTYLGISPTDESPLAYGEFELSISRERINFRLATGLEIGEEKIDGPSFVKMSQEEVAKYFIKGSGYPKRTTGFALKDGPVLLFLPDARFWEFGLVIQNMGLSSLLGPTLLYNPKQIEQGFHDRAIMRLKRKSGKSGFPTLSNAGKLEPYKSVISS
jgi:hypothetical protein